MWAEINADSLQPVPDITLGTGFCQKYIGIYKISAYGVRKSRFVILNMPQVYYASTQNYRIY